MKQKKIVGPVPKFSLPSITSNNSFINEVILKFNGTTNFLLQQECIKTFAKYLKDFNDIEDHQCAVKLLAFIYVSCTAKHPIKKSLTRILLPFEESDLLLRCLSESIKHYLQIINDEDRIDLIAVKDDFFNSLYTSFDLKVFSSSVSENLDLLFNAAVNFLQELTNILWEPNLQEVSSIPDLPLCIYNTTKFLLCILQRYNNDDLDIRYKLQLIKSLYNIIIHETITFEVKCNCGHMMALLFSNLPSNISQESIFPDYPYLEFLIFGDQESMILKKIGISKIEDAAIFEMFQICIFIGITIVASGDVLYKYKIDNKIILSFMLQKLIHSSINTKKNVHQTMGISKGLMLLSSHLQYLEVAEVESLLGAYLEYLNIYIDNVPDVVKNNSIAIFKNLIKTAEKFTREGCDLMQAIMDWFHDHSGCSNFYTVMVVLSSEVGCDVILRRNSNLAKQMLNNITNPTTAPNIIRCFEKLMQIHRKNVQCKNEWIDYWVQEILMHLRNSEDSEIFIDLFVSAFKIEPDSLNLLIKNGSLQTDPELLAFLGCIHCARKTGLPLDMSTYITVSDQNWRNMMDYKMLDILKTHINDEVRILTLGIIVDCHSSTEVFTKWELNYLIDYLSYNINVPNVSFRQRLISHLKKAMQRLNDVTISLQHKIEVASNCEQPELREKLRENATSVSQPILNYYSQFWKALYTNVLLLGLYPDSNYLRKSTSLEVLLLSKTFMAKHEFEQLWNDTDINNLKYIVDYDTYEQNKDSSTKLLIEFSPEQLNFHTKENISSYIDQCMLLALDIKPVQTISAAYMLTLCLRAPEVHNIILEKLRSRDVEVDCDGDGPHLLLLHLFSTELKECLKVAQKNIYEAAASKPAHGIIFCIRHILKNTDLNEKSAKLPWRKFCRDLINLCLELTVIVNTIVCNESPEGYLPEDSYINEVDVTAKAQIITVYGWRATKEISLLFGEISLNSPFCYNASEGIIDEQQVLTIGKYFFHLLINTKHRGAFEQASVGFCNLCTRLWRLLNTKVNVLPLEWLDTVTSLLLGTHKEGIKSCETRRSAGIPFMVQAILSTEPISGNSSKNFDSFMKILLNVGSNEIFPAEQRILALNILRALYRHNRLGEMVIPYCAEGVIIAVKGFASAVWGIRNSATLLFSALIMRIFGVQRLRDTIEVSIKNKMQGQVFFVRYPELFHFLLQELQLASKEKYHSSLYPVLLILSRLYCNKETLDRSQLDLFLPSVELCLNNPSFKIRELAALTIPALSEPSKLDEIMENCVSQLGNNSISNNHCHGLLLELQYLLRLQMNTPLTMNIEKIIYDTLWILELCGQKIHHVSATLYLENVFFLMNRYDSKFINANSIAKIIEVFLYQEQVWNFESHYLKKYNEHVFNLKLVYILRLKSHHPDLCTSEFYTNVIDNDLKNRSGILKLCLSYINYIEFTGPDFQHFNGFEENFENSQMCHQFLKPLSNENKLFLYQMLLSFVTELVTDNIESYSYCIDSLLLHKLPETTTDSIRKFLQQGNKFIRCNHENYPCLVIAHLYKFINGLSDSQLSSLNFEKYIEVLFKYCTPLSDVSVRLVVANFLTHNKKLFYNVTQFLRTKYVRALWEIVFILLEDDHEDVRKTICLLCKESINEESLSFMSQVRVDIPEYTRSKLLKQMVEVLPRSDSLEILLTHIFRSKSVTNDNLSEVFEEGSLNTYVELWPAAKAALEELYCMLNIDNEVSRKEMLLVTKELWKLTSEKSIPQMSDHINDILSCVFKEVIEQKDNLQSVVQNLLINSNELDTSEIFRLRMFLNKLYFKNLDLPSTPNTL
ncbi:hypothetical protein FQR65_LT04775 [Abscondita terminalis]|nr:hypothetical protein FQR65_LT04775 [Abscondita terminalis]